MKVLIYIYGEGDYKLDTLESRLVDKFLLDLKHNFEKNSVPTTIFKTDSIGELTKYQLRVKKDEGANDTRIYTSYEEHR